MSHNNDLVSRNNEKMSHNNVLVSHNNDLFSRNNDLVSHNNYLVSRNNNLVSRNNDNLINNLLHACAVHEWQHASNICWSKPCRNTANIALFCNLKCIIYH